MAKRAREQAVEERRERKQAKKRASPLPRRSRAEQPPAGRASWRLPHRWPRLRPRRGDRCLGALAGMDSPVPGRRPEPLSRSWWRLRPVRRNDGCCVPGTRKRARPTRRTSIFFVVATRRIACPFCGHEDWQGWDERIALDHVTGNDGRPPRVQAIRRRAQTAGSSGLQSARALDDPRSPTRQRDA